MTTKQHRNSHMFLNVVERIDPDRFAKRRQQRRERFFLGAVLVIAAAGLWFALEIVRIQFGQ